MTGLYPLGGDAIGGDGVEPVVTPATLVGVPIGQGPIGSSPIGGAVLVTGPRTLTADAGAFALTVQDAALKAARGIIPASLGAFTLTGEDATLSHLREAFGGSFTLTGQDAAFQLTRWLAGLAGDFALTGQNATLKAGRPADGGAFTLTGEDVALRFTRRLSAAAGSFALVGQDVSLRYVTGRTLLASSGAFTLTGNDAQLNVEHFLDPYRANVVLHLHFDGNYIDTTGRHLVRPVGNTVISTVQKQFGSGSMLLDGNEDYAYAQDSDDWDFGVAPFVMEGWFRFKSNRNCVLMTQWGANWAWWMVDNGNTMGFRVMNGAADFWTSWTPNLDQWYALAMERDASNVIRFYVDGVMVGKQTGFSTNISGSSASMAIGTLLTGGFGGFDFDGYIDEIRVTKGVARYASDAGYTVSPTPFSQASVAPETGVYALTAEPADLIRGPHKIVANGRALTLTGGDAQMDKRNAVGGAFVLTGQDVTLLKRVPTKLPAAAGAFALAGQVAALNRRKAILGGARNFYFLGRIANLLHGRLAAGGTGDFALTGRDAHPHPIYRLSAARGDLTLTGYEANRFVSYFLPALAGAVSLGGQPANPRKISRYSLEPGSFDLAGQDAAPLVLRRLIAPYGPHFLGGNSIRFYYDRRLAGEAGEIVLTGRAAGLFPHYRLISEGLTLALTGGSAAKDIVRTGKPARYRLTGGSAQLWAGWGGDTAPDIGASSAGARLAVDGKASEEVAAGRVEATVE